VTPRAIFARAERLAAKIGAPCSLLPQLTNDSEVRIDVEVDNGTYAWVVIERGKERKRRVTRELDDVLYWLIYDVTFSMASDYEFTHRIEAQDFRRVLFTKQIELLERLHHRWAVRAADEINRILSRYPFSDNLRPRRLAAPAAAAKTRCKPAKRAKPVRSKRR
jgi:Immunity protein 63